MKNIAGETFLAVAADAELCDKWMTLNTYEELIFKHYNLINSYTFTGNDLNKAIYFGI
jgi:hypothetical protein